MVVIAEVVCSIDRRLGSGAEAEPERVLVDAATDHELRFALVLLGQRRGGWCER